MPEHCYICGDTGRKIDGTLCDCQAGRAARMAEAPVARALFIPRDYMGIVFSRESVQHPNKQYAQILDNIRDEVCSSGKLRKSTFIASTRRRSKTIFAYSCLQELAYRGVKVFPYIDIGEAGRYLRDIDHGKLPRFFKENELDEDSMYNASVLFLKVCGTSSSEMLQSTQLLLDRRNRRGNQTVILSYYPWKEFTRFDILGAMRSCVGDGTLGTIQVFDFASEVKEDAGVH